MPAYHLKSLDRNGYIASIALIQDTESIRFADQSLAWWDRHFSWNAQGCTVLCNEYDEHLCYLFSKIDRYAEYLTLYNLFTPLASQRNGYATLMLGLVLDEALKKYVRRITFTSISTSLDFYTFLGFIYWGINDIGDYYCNLPLPKVGLKGIASMVQDSSIETLIGANMNKIFTKTNNNLINLSASQTLLYEADTLKLGESFAHDQLQDLKAKAV